MTPWLQPIGIVHSCFKEKFGIPRQPGLAGAATATLELLPPWDRDEAVRGLEEFSHLWILFLFHRANAKKWHPTVRPPRLGGNRRIGVFASRSPFRPNPIGLSAVELTGITRRQGRLLLELRGVDLLDGTPVLDIKPYVPYADSIPDARGGFADTPPGERLQVTFEPAARGVLEGMESGAGEGLEQLLRQVLELDPRPAYLESNPERSGFGMRIGGFNVRWSVAGSRVNVISIDPDAG